MSDKKIDAAERYARDFAAAAYPRVEQLPGLSGFRRKWILRTKTDLPVGQSLREVTASFVLSARQEIAKAAQGSSLDYPLPAASAIRLDDHHVVLEIDCPTVPEMGDAPLITTSVILRAADEHWHVEDIQGVPKRYWFILGKAELE